MHAFKSHLLGFALSENPVRFNSTDGSNPYPENRPLNTNYYNQVSTDFEIEARFIAAGTQKQR